MVRHRRSLDLLPICLEMVIDRNALDNGKARRNREVNESVCSPNRATVSLMTSQLW